MFSIFYHIKHDVLIEIWCSSNLFNRLENQFHFNSQKSFSNKHQFQETTPIVLKYFEIKFLSLTNGYVGILQWKKKNHQKYFDIHFQLAPNAHRFYGKSFDLIGNSLEHISWHSCRKNNFYEVISSNTVGAFFCLLWNSDQFLVVRNKQHRLWSQSGYKSNVHFFQQKKKRKRNESK